MQPVCSIEKGKVFKMDKAYKGLIKTEKALEKKTKKILDKDEKRDQFVKAGKKALKHKK
jgi:hypothetical protein